MPAAPRAASVWPSEADERCARPSPVGAVIGRILRAADFERVLGTPSRARSAHFAVHYLASVPTVPAAPCRKAEYADLSTGSDLPVASLVDESLPAGLWVGTVVPKRHARRAVTRTLLKRQIHRAVRDQAHMVDPSGLPFGLWVVRLRTAFDRKLFSSASSDALREAAAQELGAVMANAARRARG